MTLNYEYPLHPDSQFRCFIQTMLDRYLWDVLSASLNYLLSLKLKNADVSLLLISSLVSNKHLPFPVWWDMMVRCKVHFARLRICLALVDIKETPWFSVSRHKDGCVNT